MTDHITIKRALISVYDKTGIVKLAKFLAKNDVEIIASGKTYLEIFSAGIPVIEVSSYTNSPEIMEGRVKTLHPKIYGGILGIKNKHDFTDIPPIDLVITNLYPFAEVVKENRPSDEVIENIDIGGVSLIRAAAKNFKHVCVLTDIADYESLKSVEIDLDYRKKLANKAFALTYKYDSSIWKWMAKSSPDHLLIGGEKHFPFRYGENPHQNADFYTGNKEVFPRQIQGKELSYNNILDAETAHNLILEFDKPTVAIIKHTNPCGIATHSNIVHAYKTAFNCDPISSFGGIVATNQEITQGLALCMIDAFTEVIIAPSIAEEAKAILAKRPAVRVLITELKNYNQYNVRSAFGGILVQAENDSLIKEANCVTTKQPDNMEDLYFAWKVCKHVKSNGIVISHKEKVVGIGGGQMSRIDSMKLAISKSKKNELKGAVVASDGFFPFDDCVKLAAEVGISAIIQPGGSIRDSEAIDAADQNGIAMILTGMRHFKH